MEYKDYYKILGVPRDASKDDIRKAFRRLARKYHPDVAQDKAEADARFKEINEAHEVLSDPEKRRKYDQFGTGGPWKSAGARGPGGHPGQAPFDQGGFEFHFGGTGFSDFFESLFGSRGRTAGRGPRAHAGQDVEADLMVTLDESLHGATRPISLKRTTTCPTCHGSGQAAAAATQPCPACRGSGTTAATEQFQVRIPAGVGDGQRLRIPGRGEAGFGGGPAGDLFLRIHLAPHPDFRIEDGQLVHDLDLAPWEAVLGGEVAVPVPGGSVRLRIAPGTNGGTRLRVRGKGLATGTDKRGDLIVRVQIVVPETVSESERELWQRLAHESRFHPRSTR